MSTHPVDVHVGRQLRLRADLTQTELAKQVGVTFQQVQKYEIAMLEFTTIPEAKSRQHSRVN